MRDTYDTEVEKLDLTEYKARHILVDEQAQALALIERLEQGADFAELAREASTGPSGRQGGDLGWFTRRQMVPAFGEAVAGLEPGAFTREPVETRFGWHVILLEDTREAPAPGFGEVKEGVREALEKRALRDYVETLHAEADIEILEPAAEKDASAGGGAAAGDGGGEPEPSPPQ
ncbi:MAG: hypothetical protein GWO16_03910 [Gammaproteobacteria bacterium]|nr:hypothetical protein [Gammaproteobacteria bacterium]NIR28850.1 hypothetical protein [Gammaproteobacteria bacterium]NIR97231.1 hypothetical protein [Gammaproteobacteria bacterium]NIT62942.1 hypothetical protein [Gammaproteobacteria bacterium]NIV20632.1 hypothetical protein [Gammaproteobacteria bacterium]